VTSHGGLLAALGEALHTRLVRHFTPVVTRASYNIAVFFDDSAEAGNVRLGRPANNLAPDSGDNLTYGGDDANGLDIFGTS